MVFNYLMVMLGSAIGGAMRYALADAWSGSAAALPWWTLGVNVVGSFVIGLVAPLAAESPTTRLLLATGFCGGFTTFSAFSLETLELGGAPALLNVALNVLLGLGACWLGMKLGG